jgi:hypothetical protein
MKVSYRSTVIFSGKHASLHIPDEVLAQLGTNRRAPLKVTVNNHTYQSTATAVAGQCRVVFPEKERLAAGVDSPIEIEITLELDSGVREVDVPEALADALAQARLRDTFDAQTYSKRREQARQVAEAKAEETIAKRVFKVIEVLRG